MEAFGITSMNLDDLTCTFLEMKYPNDESFTPNS